MDIHSNVDLLSLKFNRGSVSALDPEIAGEGRRVELSDGDAINWTPPPIEPVIPKFDQIKQIRHLFGRTGKQVWPAWLYHKSEPDRLVKDQAEANALGVYHRVATESERNKYGIQTLWDWDDESLWRPTPYPKGFDPRHPGTGKTVIHAQPDAGQVQNAMVATLVPQVAAAVAQAMKAAGNASAPANIDPSEWEAFLRFKSFQEADKAVRATVAAETEGDDQEPPTTPASTAADNERTGWIAEAERLGVTIDRRWATHRIIEAIEKAG